jgi:hypothetical protein
LPMLQTNLSGFASSAGALLDIMFCVAGRGAWDGSDGVALAAHGTGWLALYGAVVRPREAALRQILFVFWCCRHGLCGFVCTGTADGAGRSVLWWGARHFAALRWNDPEQQAHTLWRSFRLGGNYVCTPTTLTSHTVGRG